MESIIQTLRAHHIPLKPCNTLEVHELEVYYNVTLPAAYKTFLLHMGKAAGNFMLGTDAFYHHLFQLREGAQEFLSEAALPPLPHNAFVCWMHQGYMLAWFICDGNDDPPVHFISETDEGIKTATYATLTAFFKEELKASGIAA